MVADNGKPRFSPAALKKDPMATQVIAASGVNEINVCGHGPHTLISLTPSLAARREKMAASQRKFDRFRIPPAMQMERDIACIQ
jgi:hypothetical protein